MNERFDSTSTGESANVILITTISLLPLISSAYFNYVLEVFVPNLISSPVRSLKPVGSRFGFHNGSSIDGLLDKEDVSLEAILDEDDLLQECKAQNTRLIDYFQRVDVLKRLLGYVTGQIESEEERGRFKYVLSPVLGLISN